MKFMMLQNMHDAMGGITSVNLTIANKFIEQGHDVCICSLRNGGYYHVIAYPEKAKCILINSKDEWGCPRYSQSLAMLKQAHVIKAGKHLVKRVFYDRRMAQDLKQLKQTIEENQPDVILVSHYELMDGVPQAFLKKTICHYHTTFEQLKGNAKQVAMFQNYNAKIARFLWLSQATCEKAIAFGLDNSSYIYNPISFPIPPKKAPANTNTLMFLGRISAEKRLDVLVQLFKKTCLEYNLPDWKLVIYGSGLLEDTLKQSIEECPQISFLGKTDDPQMALSQASIFALTSSFEGMPVVLLEAYANAVPCICFDCSESLEEILPANVGIRVPYDDMQAYKASLAMLMQNQEKRTQMGETAYEFVQQFDIDVIYQDWLTLLKELNLYG